MRSLILAMIGIATWYRPTEFSNPPVLYCGMYAPDTPYVALNVDWYTSGKVSCGDTVRIEWEHGAVLEAVALDAGPFTGYYIADFGPDIPIVVDVPEQYWPVTSRSGLVSVEVYDDDEVGAVLDTDVSRIDTSYSAVSPILYGVYLPNDYKEFDNDELADLAYHIAVTGSSIGGLIP